MSALELVQRNNSPTEADIRYWLLGNMCRCTGYHNIIEAIQAGAEAMARANVRAAQGHRMYDFNYHEPKTLAEATATLRVSRDGSFIAGGMSLIPALKQRRAKPSDLDRPSVDRRAQHNSARIRCRCHRRHDATCRCGRFDLVQGAIPELARFVGEMADPGVRNRATLGGSIAHSDPAADYPPALLALDATIVTTDRAISADEFFTGAFATVLQKGEIIKAVSFPIPDSAAYVKFANTTSRYAIVGVFVARRGSLVRVAITGAKSRVFPSHRREHGARTFENVSGQWA